MGQDVRRAHVALGQLLDPLSDQHRFEALCWRPQVRTEHGRSRPAIAFSVMNGGGRRTLVTLLVLALGALLLPGLAAAETYPPWDGTPLFARIASPAEPEEYIREVHLHEGQRLELINEHEAAVTYEEEGRLSYPIAAPQAHDVVGSTVPTSMRVTGANLVTFTVHHRAGNPAEGFLPFVYPILPGPGWSGGFHTTEGLIPPQETPPPATAPASPTCIVPRLKGSSLEGARRRLRSAGCRVGAVTRHRGGEAKVARVVGQHPAPGGTVPLQSPVAVTLSR